MMKKALIVVDLQNDFMPGGALAVPEGDAVVSLINRLQPLFDLVVASQDWHVAGHGSFASQHPGLKPGDETLLGGLKQILWPDHCIRGTKGAELVEDFDQSHLCKVFHKALDPEIDSYSTFFDNGHRKSTGMAEYLKEQQATHLFFAGLATDYCVKYSVLDACWLGFETWVIADACRGINLHEGDVDRSLAKMRAAAAQIVLSNQVPALVDREN